MLNYNLESPRVYRIFSAGWGTQSTAVLVAQAQGKLKIPYDQFVWANVGDDSEHPETIDYYRQIIIPFAAQHNIPLVERQKLYKGKPITLKEYFWNIPHSMPLPLFFSEGGKAQRKCTVDFKIEVVKRYIKMELKASHVVMGIGYSYDESARILTKPNFWHNRNTTWDRKKHDWKVGTPLGFWQNYEFPLAAMGIRREKAIALIKEAGLPEPPPSLCWWCPFQGRARFLDKKHTNPTMFQEIIEMEKHANERYAKLNHNPLRSKAVYFHPDRIPLELIPDQLTLWDLDKDTHCEIGVCDV